ncbi:hypothetical protein [Photorhabdus bodei]|uniref:Uncharacterized protein n=1 Tax=Photorhabdus bodei TaxID=2029681 RepID=A0ABX0APA0_9GAMM|nr:hypothetical protein [Photorhabdus bodei]NDL00720.1 hypothetical protein [Photorhabdus bodei]NDL04886.1 hypothetical protein [Photorhabdus bodei]NDL09219.1 hypothetical protein [Photorhabdus bodei]
MTGVSECSQQRGNLKDDGYKSLYKNPPFIKGRKIGKKEAEFCITQ